MGCTQSSNEMVLSPIPPPKGEPIDPLYSQGNIIDAITNDPHIHYFQKKLQQVVLPARKRKLAPIQGRNVPNNNNEQMPNQGSKIELKDDPKQNITYGRHKFTVQSYATTDQKEHQKYTDSVNSALEGNQAAVTNIMAFMVEEMADIRQGKNAKQKFDNQAYAALKCFIYLYTGHFTYKKINSQLRRSEYDKISAVIAVVKQQLEEYNKQKFARKLKANKKYGQFLNLYRGIPKPDKTMSKGRRQYWKGFTSTSIQSSVASRFGRYLFVINLDKVSPHSFMVVPDDLSQFKEQEIILFPYFYYQCISVQNFTNGARYECKQAFFTDQ